MAMQRKIDGWDGQSRPMYPLVDDCGCKWTADGKARLGVCTAHLTAACNKAVDDSYVAAVKASTCETCRDGCNCSGGPGWTGPTGCEHLGCWGPDATFDCPEAVRLMALRDRR
jgi:hypothetical protein